MITKEIAEQPKVLRLETDINLNKGCLFCANLNIGYDFAGWEFCNECVEFVQQHFGNGNFALLESGYHPETVFKHRTTETIQEPYDPCSWDPPKIINIGEMFKDRCKTTKYAFIKHLFAQ